MLGTQCGLVACGTVVEGSNFTHLGRVGSCLDRGDTCGSVLVQPVH